MSFSLGSLVFLLGAAQAIFLLLGINIDRPLQSDLKKITSLLLFNMALVMIYYVILLNKFSALYAIADTVGSAAWMAITPLFYLLCKSLLLPDWSWQAKYLSYFLIPFYFIGAGLASFLGVEIRLWALLGNWQAVLDVWMLLFFGSGIFFIGKSFLLIKKYEEEEQNRELRFFARLFLGVLFGFGIIYCFIRKAYVQWFELVMIGLFLLFILIMVYRMFKAAPFHAFFDFGKYGNNHLSKEQQLKMATQLERLMKEEQPYLNKKLSLNDLSKLSNINTNELSQLFNSYYKTNFYEFVNRYRLNYLEKILLDPENERFKITALAEKSGFNSKATFYKAFKTKHKLTPSQFVKAHRKRS